MVELCIWRVRPNATHYIELRTDSPKVVRFPSDEGEKLTFGKAEPAPPPVDDRVADGRAETQPMFAFSFEPVELYIAAWRGGELRLVSCSEGEAHGEALTAAPAGCNRLAVWRAAQFLYQGRWSNAWCQVRPMRRGR